VILTHAAAERERLRCRARHLGHARLERHALDDPPGERKQRGGRVERRRRMRELADGRVTPGPAGLRRLVQYYRAHLGLGPFPPVACNAPWMSVYIGADGAVRPCFFHPPVGNIRQRPLREIMTVGMPAFRRALTVADDATCQRCVCNIKTGLRTRLW